MSAVPINFDNCLAYCPRALMTGDIQERFDALADYEGTKHCPGPIALKYLRGNVLNPIIAEVTEDSIAYETMGPPEVISCGAMYTEEDLITKQAEMGQEVKALTQQELREAAVDGR